MVSAEENLGASEEQTTVQSAEQQEQQTPKKRRMTRAIFAALLLFVAIPIPGTGAWTGGLVAALFDLPKRWSILAIALGVLTSGVIMTLASYGVLGFLNIFL
ncbi:MAG: small multi-drug export protein [Clostridia bacterium]|nr:small multi-drug export protein [Clostridia bacterium]